MSAGAGIDERLDDSNGRLADKALEERSRDPHTARLQDERDHAAARGDFSAAERAQADLERRDGQLDFDRERS